MKHYRWIGDDCPPGWRRVGTIDVADPADTAQARDRGYRIGNIYEGGSGSVAEPCAADTYRDTTGIRWEAAGILEGEDPGDRWLAYAGKLLIASVYRSGRNEDFWMAIGFGPLVQERFRVEKSPHRSKSAVEDAWEGWLLIAGLMVDPVALRDQVDG